MASGTRLLAVARMNRRLWHNCLAGTDDVLWARPRDGVNALGFLALHLLDARHFILGLLGTTTPHPFAELLQGIRSMAELREQPPLDTITPAWDTVSDQLQTALAAVSAERLAEATPQRFPLDDATVHGSLEFLLHHESYHIGQMALLRRFFGLAPMSYR